jgi:LysR family transcriptional regulator for bpeEF and oprC
MVDGSAVEVKMKGVVSVNDSDAYMACGLQGFGLIQPPRFMALPYLQNGTLKEILPSWKPKPMPISVVYPHNRHLSPKVRAFTDWVAEIFSRCSLLNGRGEGPLGECTWAGEEAARRHAQRPELDVARAVAHGTTRDDQAAVQV